MHLTGFTFEIPTSELSSKSPIDEAIGLALSSASQLTEGRWNVETELGWHFNEQGPIDDIVIVYLTRKRDYWIGLKEA